MTRNNNNDNNDAHINHSYKTPPFLSSTVHTVKFLECNNPMVYEFIGNTIQVLKSWYMIDQGDHLCCT